MKGRPYRSALPTRRSSFPPRVLLSRRKGSAAASSAAGFLSPRLLLEFLVLVALWTAPNPSDCFRAATATTTTTTTRKASRQSARAPNDSSMEATAATEEAGSTGLRVGFLGCGVIASSIARGLAGAAIESGNNAFGIESILLSRRSESRSGPLAEELAEKSNGAFGVSIAGDDNQEILDGSDLVFLTVLPQQASAVLESLEFDPERHVLVSLVSTAKLEDLVRDSKLAPSRVSKMICLPSIAQHRGVALLCCGSDGGDGGGSSTQTNTRAFLTGLFGATGGCVALDTEADLEACMVTTCTMGPLYGTMKKQRDWLLATCTGSLSREDATFLVIKQFAGAVAEAETATTKSESGENDERGHESSSGLSNKLEELIAEQTPGGLNEQALRNYGEVLGGFEDLQQPVMDAILSRIRGETDGSLGAS